MYNAQYNVCTYIEPDLGRFCKNRNMNTKASIEWSDVKPYGNLFACTTGFEPTTPGVNGPCSIFQTIYDHLTIRHLTQTLTQEQKYINFSKYTIL